MSGLTLRLKTKDGQHVLRQLDLKCSVDDLKNHISQITKIQGHALKILMGFPPQPVDLSDGNQTLATLNFRSGDTLIVEEDAKAKAKETHKKNEELMQHLHAQEQSSSGILTRKVVPANNSCLFTSVDYVMERRSVVNLESAAPMRKLIATIVGSDKSLYNPGLLGKSNKDYCKWIMHSESWGGAIEISILSKYYSTEIDVVDTTSARIDRFGEDQNYTQRVLLIYDGIHYDPLVLESLDVSNLTWTTIFPTDNHNILIQAQEIAEEAKSSRQFTDVNQFSIRCLVCNTSLKGQVEAQAHATSTGHINFGEI